ncbi:hypothetical protein PHAMO_210091 [Magnetospirillum molischianum DSM 120]|uniref:Uncharacterized protein n=1 Tax=Magnetospirillum molischianum DSM 120 TaxID=1150626 RepID=H8FQE2_MAGML|nr:hypothetical protein PHAMO_210091 [Magnetospirillum molischianum DSM 120]
MNVRDLDGGPPHSLRLYHYLHDNPQNLLKFSQKSQYIFNHYSLKLKRFPCDTCLAPWCFKGTARC